MMLVSGLLVPLTQLAPARADEAPIPPAPAGPSAAGTQIFLDVDLEGTSLGRITIELLPDAAPIAAARFRDLAVGREGVSLRRRRFNGILPDYLRVEGVPALSFSSSRQSPIAGTSSRGAGGWGADPRTGSHGAAIPGRRMIQQCPLPRVRTRRRW